MFATLYRDITSVVERDPAARSKLEVVLCYPGLHALWTHRVAHWLWRRGLRLAARLLSQFTRAITGIEIHPGARIGPGFFIDHGMGVVIGETAEVGANVTIYHGVTLGGTTMSAGKRHPTLQDGAVVGAGAKVLGNITIGANSRIGANAVVVKPVPANSVVVGVPGQIVTRSRRRSEGGQPDLDHTSMPDTLGVALASLIGRVETLERQAPLQPQPHLNGSQPAATHSVAPHDGLWHGEDFSI
jgi:serine O-acetyltransferase